jgi:hypothetical protein
METPTEIMKFHEASARMSARREAAREAREARQNA